MLIRISAALVCLTAVSLSAQDQSSADQAHRIRLIHGEFDPASDELPELPVALRAADDVNLWIVQFSERPTERGRERVRALGAEVHGYLPDHAHIVRMASGAAAQVATLADVRWVGPYEPGYRLERLLRDEIADGVAVPVRSYNLVVVDKRADKPALAAAIRGLGGRVEHEQPGSLLFQASLTGAQLVRAARLDQVLWIDRWTAPEEDMNNARIQGGADFIEAQGGYTGAGVRGHIYEGVDAASGDFTITPTNVQSCGSTSSHGQSTAGIVFGNGNSNPNARGMAPEGRMFYTNYDCVTPGVSRWQVVDELVNVHQVMFTTASWGDARTRAYTSVSADADDIVFDHGIAWTNSQSNAGNQDSRPQAWAKNVISIGGVRHGNNADRSDDSWSGGGSTGPAADGRIKPELSAYYDGIWTTNTTSFGGTSGATPIVAGHNALAIQMFADGVFGNPPRVPGGSMFENRPKATTLKALQVANARQYEFTSTSTDNRREHVGFGFPDLKTMYLNGPRMLVIDETDVLTQGGSIAYPIAVGGTEGELKVAMSYADPAANPAAAITRVNDLDLKVTSPSGVVYHGNNGISDGNYSAPAGAPNSIDTLECVFVLEPEAGVWVVEVSARLIAIDGHVETAAVDVDFGLVATFGNRESALVAFGSGCVGTGTTPPYVASANVNGGTLASDTRTHEYCYDVTTLTAASISEVEFFTRSLTGQPEVTIASIYGAGPTVTAVASTQLTVGVTPGFYRATFNPPVSVPAGRFHVAMSHAGATTALCDLTSGTPIGGYYRRTPFSGSWTRSGLIDFASVRVTSPGGGGQPAVPVMLVSGAPEIGLRLDYRVERVRPSTGAVLATGASDTGFNGIPLPLSLAVIGAPGCSMLVSNDGILPLTIRADGSAAPFSIDIPTDFVLSGQRFFQQVLVLDPPANAAGVVTTSAYRIEIGN